MIALLVITSRSLIASLSLGDELLVIALFLGLEVAYPRFRGSASCGATAKQGRGTLILDPMLPKQIPGSGPNC